MCSQNNTVALCVQKGTERGPLTYVHGRSPCAHGSPAWSDMEQGPAVGRPLGVCVQRPALPSVPSKALSGKAMGTVKVLQLNLDSGAESVIWNK